MVLAEVMGYVLESLVTEVLEPCACVVAHTGRRRGDGEVALSFRHELKFLRFIRFIRRSVYAIVGLDHIRQASEFWASH